MWLGEVPETFEALIPSIEAKRLRKMNILIAN